MKGLIISNPYLGHNVYKINRFKEESIKLNITLDVALNNGNLCYIDNGEVVSNIGEYDFVVYLDKDIYLANLLEKAGYKVYNSADFIRLCDDKALTFVKSSNLGINMVKTITPPLIFNKETYHKIKSEFLSHVAKELGYPLIGKLSYSSLGEGVFKLNNFAELEEFYSKYYTQPFVFQKYVINSKGRSLRVLVINEEIIGAIERINETDFRSNAAKSYSKLHQLDEKYLSFAKNIAKTLKIKYAGIDILFGEDGPVLCEINSNAFFEEFEKVTGVNVAYKFLKFIVNDVK